MTVILSPETEALIQRQIETGRYSDANEVLLAAMEELDRCEHKLKDALAHRELLDPSLVSRLENAKSHSERLSIAQHLL